MNNLICAGTTLGKPDRIMDTRRLHWDRIFTHATDDSRLGWYEKDSSQTLKYLEMTRLSPPATVFLAGAGTSTLADDLLTAGYGLIVNDVSGVALAVLRDRTGSRGRAAWLEHDLARPLPDDLPIVDLWIDRAVLHFLLEETEIDAYFANMQNSVRPGGYVLQAQFSTQAAAKCAGLDLHRYSLDELCRRVGEQFSLIHHETYQYTMPGGDLRPYLYALFKKRTELKDVR